ncbi:MAG: lipoyl synthase [bacterium]
MNPEDVKKRRRLPAWIKMKMPEGENYSRVKNLVTNNNLHTICTSGNCPNIGDCWGRGTATLMILGDTCTRSCKFCGVKTGKPLPPDPGEPSRVAETVKIMKLRHCVITSVDRDDLPDGGSSLWAETIKKMKEVNPETTIEVLIPDFMGKTNCLDKIIEANPEVISHNLETVRRLTPKIRSVASYERSLDVLRYIAKSGVTTKSGIMLGLGETREEVLGVMDDLLEVGCKVFTVGQYLQPSVKHMPVVEFIPPLDFEFYYETGLEKGFKFVESSPLVRSSFQADKHVGD